MCTEKLFELKIKFIARVVKDYPFGNTHEIAFWEELLKDTQALDQFYRWCFFEAFREWSGFEVIADQLVKKEDLQIIQEIISRLPEETAAYFRDLIDSEGSQRDLKEHLFDKWILKIFHHFKSPEVFDIQYQEIPSESRTFTLLKLHNASKYNLTSVSILSKANSKHFQLIVVENRKVLFEGFFNSLMEAQNGFRLLFRDRATEDSPAWSKVMEFTEDGEK